MKVKELIEELQKYDSDQPVMFRSDLRCEEAILEVDSATEQPVTTDIEYGLDATCIFSEDCDSQIIAVILESNLFPKKN